MLGLIRMGAFHELFKSDACFHESVTAPAVKYTVNDQEERIMGHETMHAFVHTDYTHNLNPELVYSLIREDCV